MPLSYFCDQLKTLKMSFFSSLLQKHSLPKHNGQPLWKYMLGHEEIEKLVKELQFARPLTIDPRDVTLYYSQWWKKSYKGGKPSKQEIFDSLGGNSRFNFDSQDFYKLAKKGAKMLGIKWITKQNTLYFRTLLLQGGLPLTHISENHGNYQNFLMAVLEEQPETIEDFIFNSQIISLLPRSSQNDIIYESCFEIVRAILNKDDEYDDLFKSDDSLSAISKTLKAKERTLERVERLSKPKNYWLLSFGEEKVSIRLRIGLADTYNNKSLSGILGFEITGREYQLYLNDDLICIFRRMVNGKYKTVWYSHPSQEWNLDNNLPNAYVIQDGKKIEVNDFIQTIPNLQEPSLWAPYSDKEWRLLKGSGASNKEAAILFPPEWNCDVPSTKVSLYNAELSWLAFEGEVEIWHKQRARKYFSEVTSFDWTIVSQKPSWILKGSMPIVKSKPQILVYDENEKRLPENRFKIWVKKHIVSEDWIELNRLSYIPIGCLDIKIEKDGLVAYDMFFNIGDFRVKYNEKSIDIARVELINKNNFEFNFEKSPLFEINESDGGFFLQVHTQLSKVPTGLKGSMGNRNQKKLCLELVSPFEGLAIIDKEGKIISAEQQLSLANLHGLRILSTPKIGTILSIKNRLKPAVKITKEIMESSQPVISFKEEIVRLYYLADAMDYKNKVCLELVEGKNSKTYEISGFSHTLDIKDQLNGNIGLFNSDDDLDLFAIPLNCPSESIGLIPLIKNESSYEIPSTPITNQFIIISSNENGNQLMPRFVTTNESNEGSSKEERIDKYHAELYAASLDNEIWKQLLSYFGICIENDIPFSTFDQLRAISRSSQAAARAFLFIGINQADPNYFIQKAIPEFEKDLGFCFHWIKNKDWELALNEVNELHNDQYFEEIVGLVSSYMRENNLFELFQFINGNLNEVKRIYNTDISNLRAQLGERVLNELPYRSPRITKDYNIAINQHKQVKLLLRAPIAVAESITDTQQEYPIWAGDDFRDMIRRNIQYSQYLNPEFYKSTILHVLKTK